MSVQVLEKLKAQFGSAIVKTNSALGDDTAWVEAAQWKLIAAYLRSDPELLFDFFVDLCAVDYPNRLPRFEVVLHLYSHPKKHRVCIKTAVGGVDGEGAVLDSLVPIWKAANWLEREVYDMMGVVFQGHPDLRRILMYPEFVGYPLRKDYPADRTQPLVAYRTEEEAGVPLNKLPPFGPDEGMSFSRKVWNTSLNDEKER
ncbi:NADH-quinone oxidoreductase subunit C [Pajaroellobacter abortibovis]|uniref:NADH-quinone oxidoreductase subunit C n=1 Tax=Pajaroellobacter abortibovis TaxID=1882918 RepID=A0A1L6MX60_9BACT|nr:NADH-quinone oxidoreductase subunit C [Pajaroellobacter abortibovis]APS00141.1 hypothetical protein BCY86_05195 [Pajaroellobacter abortibovis]